MDVWDGRLDRSRDEAGSWVRDQSTGRGNFGGKCGVPHCNQLAVCSVVAAFPKLLLILWRSNSH